MNDARPLSPSPLLSPGIQFGAAVRPEQLSQHGLLFTAIRQCDILVPEYHGQWSAVEWRKGDPWFGNYDAITNFAQRHNQQVRCHSLLWEQMTPDWARKEMLARHDWNTVSRYFKTVLPRYSGQIHEWVVVNEMIDTEHGDANMRRTTFQRAYGNDYIERALETARICDPNARLMINDYSLCHDNPVDKARRIAMLKLVERLKSKGAPLDMVGLQGHLEIAKGPVPQKRMERFLADLAAMGVTLAFTEVDVLEADRSLPVAERDRLVTEAVTGLMDVVREQPAVTSITTWGLSDRHSWLQDKIATLPMAGASVNPVSLNRGLPFDALMRPKQMGHSLAKAVSGSRFSGFLTGTA